MPHRQVQRHYTITARGVGEGVFQIVRTGSNIGMLIPIKTVASKRCRVTRIAMAHCQMQGHHAVTTRGIRKRMRKRIRAGGDIRVFIPVETVASERSRVARIAVSNCQVQGHHAVATRGVSKGVRQAVRA